MTDQLVEINDETQVAFVRKRLSPEAAAAVSQTAAAYPGVAADLVFTRGIVEALDGEAAETPGPGALGWARLSRAIDAEVETAAPRRRWLPAWQLVGAAAGAVLLWQTIVVPQIVTDGGAGFQPVGEAGAFALAVGFAEDASEGEIRALLLSIGGRITDGPSALNLWQVSFDDAVARDAALSAFDAETIVTTAAPR
jgi:hypothetical protein